TRIAFTVQVAAGGDVGDGVGDGGGELTGGTEPRTGAPSAVGPSPGSPTTGSVRPCGRCQVTFNTAAVLALCERTSARVRGDVGATDRRTKPLPRTNRVTSMAVRLPDATRAVTDVTAAAGTTGAAGAGVGDTRSDVGMSRPTPTTRSA